jgi:lytic murein transglycosylase
MFLKSRFVAAAVSFAVVVNAVPARAADAAFQKWLEALWPEAQAMGISRATFEGLTRNLEPDRTLPDLIIPGRVEDRSAGQPEFTRTPAEYLSESTLNRLAGRGRELLQKHRATLAAVEEKLGVKPEILLAIWGRETNFGDYKLPHNAIRVLATQDYLGRRKDYFRNEFLLALKMVQEGHVKLADMRASWAGAMGHTQFLPSDFYRFAVDFDGDGRRDIWNSIPDSLASAAKQLLDKGWVRGRRWGYEVHAPKDVDCTTAQPEHTATIAEWLRRGYMPAGRKIAREDLHEQASLFLPAGPYGPAFLTLKNFYVLKDYNFADLYALFVGHLSDRIVDGRGFETAWGKVERLRSDDVEAVQRLLAKAGLYDDKIDGRAGMKTRAALGAYQKARAMKVDCWLTPEVIAHAHAAMK